MNLPPFQVALIAAAAVAVVWALAYLDRVIAPHYRAYFRFGAVVLVLAAFFFGVQRLTTDVAIGADIGKGAIAAIAGACVLFEMHRRSIGRPVAERWKMFVGVTLAVASITAYYNGWVNGYHKVYHRHELYHYYLGAKYFPEMGYDGLYKCTVIAQSEMGVYEYKDEDSGRSLRIDMTKEARHPDRKVRNLGDDNLLVSAQRFLEHPEICTSVFKPERWAEFKSDIAFFRVVSGQDYFNKMQLDHGFNPPPVWTIMGKVFSELHSPTTKYMQFLSTLDLMYLLAMFWALGWAFGWRVSAVAAIFWGCQSPAPMLWTCGAFLRQDYLFFMVLSLCLLKKKYPALAAAALVYSALLRIFPGVLVVGWVAVLFWQLVKHRRPTKEQVRMIIGGVLAAAVLLGVSIKMCGAESYKSFYNHTLKVHDETPLTNHMGLRVLLAQKTPVEFPALGIGVGKESGRMKYSEDNSQPDPFFTWKKMRNDRYQALKPIGYLVNALTLGLFFWVARRMKSMWIAQSTAGIFLMTLAQLTSYYFAFMIVFAPLTKVKPLQRTLELTLFGFAVISQFAFRSFRFNDDKYWILTLLCMGLGYILILAFAPRTWWDRICAKLPFVDRAARAVGLPGARA